MTRDATVAEVVHAAMDQLSAAELKVARAVLAGYPTAALGSTGDLAARAEVSPATVVRFVSRLGYRTYRELQQQLRDEVQRERIASPLTLPTRTTGTDLRVGAAQLYEDTVGRTFSELPNAELATAIDLLVDPHKRVFVWGGRYSHLLAVYLELHLRQLRPRTSVLEERTRQNVLLLGIGKGDVCVVLDFRRYQLDTVRLGEYARSRGAQLIVMTDPWLSPLASKAESVLVARVEGPSPFDSIVPATAIAETVVAGVLQRLGSQAQQRMRQADEAAADDLETDGSRQRY